MTSLPSLGPRGEGWVAIQGILLVIAAVAGLSPDDSNVIWASTILRKNSRSP